MERIHDEEEFGIIYKNAREAFRSLDYKIPEWNIKQNNVRDKKSNIIYKIDDMKILEETKEFKTSDKTQRDYYIRRWFNHKWALCDEYLFCTNPNCSPNPIFNDKKYDVNIAGNLMDIKGTVVPKRELQGKGVMHFINNPGELVKWYYDQQSTGGRYGLQNRLFIVHYSETGEHDRCRFAFGNKRRIYEAFCSGIDKVTKFPYSKDGKDCFGMILFICEGKTGIKGFIPGIGWC